MNDHRRQLILILILISIATFVSGITYFLLYDNAIKENRERLVLTVKSQVRLIESIARHEFQEDLFYDKKFRKTDGYTQAINQIIDAHKKSQDSKQSEELTLAKLEDSEIVFLLPQNFSKQNSIFSIPLESDKAECMRRALMGESGTLVGPDYRGIQVLAAYEPIKELQIGMVAKIDMAEIRQPYIKTGIIIGFITLGAVLVGAFLFFRTTKPVFIKLKVNEKKYRYLFDHANDAIFLVDPETREFIDFNERAAKQLGYTRKELSKLNIGDISLPEHAERIEEDLKELIRTGNTIFETVHLGKNGIRIPVEISCRVIEYEGKKIFQSFARNISERKEAEKEQRNSQRLLRNVFDTFLPQLIVKDKEARYLIINKAWSEFYGLSQEMMIGKTVQDIKTQPDEEKYQILLEDEKVLSGKKIYSIMDSIRTTHKGEKRFQHIIRTPLLDDNDKVSGLVICTVDITDQKQVLEALKESEEKFRVITTSAKDAIIMIDDAGEVTFWNQAAQIIFGFSEKEILGKKMVEYIIPNGFRKYHSTGFEKFLKRGSQKKFEKAFETFGLRKTGEEFPLELTLSSISLNGRLFSIGFIRDITERKKTEEERFRLVNAIEQSTETILITDNDGYIQYINSAVKNFNYTQEELLGKHTDEFLDIKDSIFNFSKIASGIMESKAWDGAVIWKKKGGGHFEMEATISQFKDESGQTNGFVIVARDVSREIQLERQLRHSQKMEELGIFSNGIVHDLNSSLGIIRINTEMAMEDIKNDHLSSQSLRLILKATKRSIDLVEQILAFSREKEIDFRPIEIELVIKEALNLIRALTLTTIEIHSFTEAATTTVMADKTQIHQVVMNLCANASHAMRESGGILEINLSTKILDEVINANCNLLNPGPYLVLRVKDSGIGIEENDIPKIFDPFFTTKGPLEGSGMGLAVVYGIVKQHKGGIFVESKPGKGTTFQIYLPLVDSEIEPRKSTLLEFKKGSGRILLVDDMPENIETYKRVFNHLGYETTGNTSSVDALDSFRENPDTFDLIIVDQIMPQMTGLNFAKEASQIRPDIPIILLTGSTEFLNQLMVKNENIIKIINKTIGIEKLAEVIHSVLDAK